jgi:hypothetical protein
VCADEFAGDVVSTWSSDRDRSAMQVILSDFMSLDGVVHAPGGRQEDTDGDFRMFPQDGQPRPLQLVTSTTATTGVLICTYRPAGR